MSRCAFVGLFVSVGLATTGCNSSAAQDKSVSARVEVIDHTSSGLTGLVSEVEAINGVYGDACRDYAGSAWSVAVSGTPSLANPALRVVQNDANCTLTLTEIVTSGSTYPAAPSLLLALDYAPSGSAFSSWPGGPAAFFANADIDTTSFAADFTINLVVSDQPHGEWGYVPASHATQTSTVVASGVAAPDYWVDTSGLIVMTDANQFVTSATGYVQLQANTTEAQTFAIYKGHLPPFFSLDEMGAAWDGAAVKGNVSDLDQLRVTADQLDFIGTQSWAERCVMLRNTQDGVFSYEVINMFIDASR